MSIIPVLDSRDDALSCDWPDADYRCVMTTVNDGQAARAVHMLTEARGLAELVAGGLAAFAVEVVSPATFTSQLHLAPEGSESHTFDIDAGAVSKEGAQARPGVVAVRDCELSLAQCRAAWHLQGESVRVAPGQWLARCQHSELTSPQTSLLRFIPDKALRRHEMRCAYAETSYEISMHPEDLAACQQDESNPAAKTVMLAAWTAALADANRRGAFGGSNDGGDDGEQKESMAFQLEAKLKALDPKCPVPGEDDYDPLRAATVLLGSDMIDFGTEDGLS